MEYLAGEKVLHRDLAARNCMYVEIIITSVYVRTCLCVPSLYFFYSRIDMNMIIKVSDFGLAVNTGDRSYYHLSNNQNNKLPVRWMAPESLSTQIFSEKSDVVSVHSTVINYITAKFELTYYIMYKLHRLHHNNATQAKQSFSLSVVIVSTKIDRFKFIGICVCY